jgi:Cu+-exporting ATPase
MNLADFVVIAAGAASIALLSWYFFGPKKARQAELVGQVQEVKVTVKGGYSPNLIRVRQDVPLRIVFDRQESGECTSRIVFPDFALNRALPAYATTAVEFTPDRSGRFGFACGMNMVHGTLVVEPNGQSHGNGHVEPATVMPAQAPIAERPELDSPDAEVAERKAEIADLTRRVIVAAIFTAPVLYVLWSASSSLRGCRPSCSTVGSSSL